MPSRDAGSRDATGSRPAVRSPRRRRSRSSRSGMVPGAGSSSSLSLGSPRTQVAGVQRARILSAAARVVGDLGYEGMSVARITAGAGISRRTFYEQYEHREDCFLDLFEEVATRARGVVQEAAAGHESWRERIRAGLLALLVFIDEEPALGALLVVDALSAGPRVLERRARELERLSKIIDQGRGEARKMTRKGSSSLTAEGVVGAVLGVIHARLLTHGKGSGSANGSRARGPSRSLTGLLNPLMGVIVLPYLGQDAATEELTRPRPKTLSGRSKARGAPRTPPPGRLLEGLDMRLTYRTLRVISGVAAQPGASNRQVADAAGIHDQGQISKLLSRLERLDLVQNTGEGQTKGEPNAWTLTTRGTQIQRTVEAQTAGITPPT